VPVLPAGKRADGHGDREDEGVDKLTEMKRPKDCPKKDKPCPIEKTRYCLILTKLRRDGHGCCEDNS
jgi:hypothetical protein